MAWSLVGGLSLPVQPKGLILGPVLFNMFWIDVLDNGEEHTFGKFVDDTKLWGLADLPEGHAAIQRDLNRAEKWADSNLKFSKRRWKVLGRNKHRHQDMLGNDQLENNLVEKDLGVLMDTKFNMSQEYAIAAKEVHGILGWI